MSILGMDIGEMFAVSSKLKGSSGDLQRLTTEIDGLVRQAMSHWEGADAQQFLEWWENEHKPPLMAAQRTLANLGAGARRAAEDQERVSGG